MTNNSGQSSSIGIILLDDHTWIHQAVTDLMNPQDDIQLLGLGTRGDQAPDLYREYQPDIVLMDIVMPEVDGIAATQTLLLEFSDAKVLALSSLQDERSVFDMLRAGAIGYLIKTNLSSELIPTVRTLYSGGAVLSAPIVTMLTHLEFPDKPQDENDFGLTDREIEVLRALATGDTNNGVAYALNISTPTVRFHINNIIEKMEVGTRTEAIVLGVRHGII